MPFQHPCALYMHRPGTDETEVVPVGAESRAAVHRTSAQEVVVCVASLSPRPEGEGGSMSCCHKFDGGMVVVVLAIMLDSFFAGTALHVVGAACLRWCTTASLVRSACKRHVRAICG
jgi:hypothetical protein